MPNSTSDVLIIGAGVIGLGIADALARRGISVTILERERAGSRASWAGAGMLNLRPHRRHDGSRDVHAERIRRSIALHAQWAQRLLEETDIDVGFTRCGSVEVFLKDGEDNPNQRSPEDILAGCAANDVPAQRLSLSQLAQLEPHLSMDSVAAAIHLPNDGQVRSPRLVKALIQSCRQLGVSIIEHVDVLDVWMEAGVLKGALISPGEHFCAHKVIVCAGAWTGRLHTLRTVLPDVERIAPVRGQIVCFQLPQPLLKSIVTVGHHYLVPRAAGVLLSGSTTEHVGYESIVTPEGQGALYEFAVGLVPALKGVEPAQGWADFRPGMSGPHPFVGAVPGVEGLFVAAGHYRDGLCLAPLTAETMSELVCGCATEV
ncbi:MAG TPA: FAD-dependent oxidoreductase [Planctomycetota bacterium]|nr:FAD-dependent oxidoreductase [Planctomycetota bacterium]